MQTAELEQAALLALLRLPNARWASLTDDVEACGSAFKVLEAIVDPTGRQGDLFDDSVGSERDRLVESAMSEIEAWANEGIRLVTILDADYPSQLLTIHQRPPFLLYRGRLSAADSAGVAVVGTRNPSRAGVARASEIAKGLAERGVTVVSGLASGIDTAAHVTALAEGGRTVAVIGTGLRRAYPSENAALQARIAREYLVLSQFLPDAPPTKASFPMRNAVMSGYSAATVVIEAAWKSGARMQARLALEHGRPVFLHDSLMQHDWAREYVTRGAIAVASAADVLEALDDRLNPNVELVWS